MLAHWNTLMKAFLVLEKLAMQEDELYSVCERLLAEIETLTEQKQSADGI